MEQYYNFSDEDEREDEILDRAMERWEQLGGGGVVSGPLFKFRLREIGKRRTWRDVVQRQQFDVELIQLRDAHPSDNIGIALTESLYNAIENELIRQNRPAHHFINFAITANSFAHAYQTTNFTVGEFLQRTARLDEMLQKLAGKLNSNEAFNPSQGFSVDVVFVKMPGKGKGRKKNNPGQRCLDRENKKKKCIITINNQDDLCCARAIVTMRAYCHKNEGMDEFRKWDNLKRGYPVQKGEAQELHRQAGVPEGACGLPELEQFQQALGPSYQLLAMIRMHPFYLFYKGPPAPNQICLLKSNNHYDGCTSFSAFQNRSYYCIECERAFNTNDKSHHSCRGKRCTACSRFNCEDYIPGTQPSDYCSHCHTKFFGIHCKQHHFASNQCETQKTCLQCQGQYAVINGKRHRCGYAKCNVCKEYVYINNHRCYIQPVVQEKEVEETEEPTEEGGGSMVAPPPPLFVYADIEAYQNEENVFIANLLCYSSSEEEDIHVLDGDNCTLQFLHELDDLAEVPDNIEQQREVIVVFHNLKAFDGIFIINELYQQQRQVINQLTVGAKVLSFTSGPLKFIDSLSFLPMPLASFPATFNLKELKKGFFPHLFNTPENQQYVGRIPDLEFYDPDGMMPAKKEELLHWHDEQVRRNVTFIFKEELIAYCKSDVQLLKQGCMKFQQEFSREAGFNPMAHCFTIASACNLYWRKHHLEPNTIAVEPIRGWRGANVNHSLKSLQWLYFQEQLIPKNGASADRIRHVRNGGEQTVRTSTSIYYVDGYDASTNTIYEFHGCLYHGCPTCYPMRDIKHYCAPDRTVQELYNATEAKRTALLHAGYNVFECWECQWDEQVKTNQTVQRFLASFDLVAPLNPRDAFYGGRTGAVVLHSAVGEGEEIRYADITSLYPYVNKTGTYPVGHPHIITQPADQSIHSYFGIALVDILPPAGLFHPVLPVRYGKKLTFPLCSKCVQEEQTKPMLQRTHYCSHTDVERMLRGTWCTPEIEKAIEKGYQIIKIHEVWHFPESQRKTGLFAEYVDKWLKLKQESAGWPSWCETLEQKRRYIQEYQEREGIRIDISKIAKNPGRKATAKLMLNSFWGKFGEKLNKPTTVAVKEPSHLFSLLSDTTKEISTIRICTDDILEAVYTSVNENAPKGTKNNIFIAAFTTSLARLKLYESLDLLNQQVLYMDTDSVFYKWRHGLKSISTGDFLGQMKDELEGDVITDFVSAGAKNYAYLTRGGNSVCKVRGFTLNARGSAILNFQSMKQNILDELHIPQDSRRNLNIVTPYHFQRDVEKKQIRVVPRVKQYGLVFDKRVLNTNAVSYPYGFRRIGDELQLLLDL
ncbi:unnamed protein product [Porites lobata]|uniref:DNA-directed DNA polymerase n=1 Tax=Porites lobata TaxID=104759 RepID=A0ABN8QPB7_9CNID|nr:unnamed protein product [Porites lobata]